jgi:Cupin-like domain
MKVSPIDRVEHIAPEDFRRRYLIPSKPVIITHLSHDWAAYEKWTWDYFIEILGDVRVGVYNNVRADAHVPVNGADGTMLMRDYLTLIQKGPVELRIFLFNFFKHAPYLTDHFTYPEHLLSGFLKKHPMLFVGGAGSIAHMHYDLDLSHIFHTQFIGRKRVLLLHNDQSPFIYPMPATVESAASFANWEQHLDTEKFPALQYASAYESVLTHGDTLFMPTGYWHHMQYLDSGFAMSLRALPAGIPAKVNTLYHLLAMRGFNNALIKTAPHWWYNYKRRWAQKKAQAAMARAAAITVH